MDTLHTAKYILFGIPTILLLIGVTLLYKLAHRLDNTINGAR